MQKEMIDNIAALLSMPKTHVKYVLKSFVEEIQHEIAKGNEVRVDGLCKFTLHDRAAREGRNPITGEALHIPAKKVCSIKPMKALKDCAAGS